MDDNPSLHIAGKALQTKKSFPTAIFLPGTSIWNKIFVSIGIQKNKKTTMLFHFIPNQTIKCQGWDAWLHCPKNQGIRNWI